MNTTSDDGLTFLERQEGVVLKAYRCPAGKWTIGGGLTAASGVVKPHAGLVITSKEARRLLRLALDRNYEPTVREALPDANQHEFDGAVSFHFNTGAIQRASWVKAWRARNWPEVRSRLNAWRKGGGKVLPGLVSRRAEEYQVIRFGKYRNGRAAARVAGTAKEVVPIGPDERMAIGRALHKLGYLAKLDVDLPQGVPEAAIRSFQREHDLTVDGVIGRATLATLQRRIDASLKTTLGGTAAAAGTAEVSTGMVGDQLLVGLPDWATWAVAGVAVLYLVKIAWDYRDVVAAKIQRPFPETADFLRSL